MDGALGLMLGTTTPKASAILCARLADCAKAFCSALGEGVKRCCLVLQFEPCLGLRHGQSVCEFRGYRDTSHLNSLPVTFATIPKSLNRALDGCAVQVYFGIHSVQANAIRVTAISLKPFCDHGRV